MRIACRIPKATDTHSEYVMLTANNSNEVIPLCYLNIYFITQCFRQHN